MQITVAEAESLLLRHYEGAVLTLRDPKLGYVMSNLCWKDETWFRENQKVDGLCLFRVRDKWYSKKHKGKSWRTREEAVSEMTAKPPVEETDPDNDWNTWFAKDQAERPPQRVYDPSYDQTTQNGDF